VPSAIQERPLDDLTRLCERSLSMLPVDAAAVAVMNRAGHWGIVHATDDCAARLEDTGFTIGEGPGVDAFSSREPVLIGDFNGHISERWPAYAHAAAAAHCLAVFAFPLCVGAIPVGTLTYFAHKPTRLSDSHLGLISSVSSPVAFAVAHYVDATVMPTGHAEGGRGETGNTSFLRAEVYQASGMIMAQLGVPIDEALARLRAYAFAHDRPINDVARDVVTRTVRFTPDTS
jgi:hypothetical protein